MRLIDADALIEELEGEFWYESDDRYNALDVVGHAPTIDVNKVQTSADRPQVNSAEWVAEKEKEFEELNRPSGDLISREDAIDVIEALDWYHINKKGEMVHGATSNNNAWYKAEDIYKALNELPSADRPQGEWKTNNTYKGLVFCDECGMPFKDSLMPRNYCPCCGADMGKDGDK